jgi:hypothetical protein
MGASSQSSPPPSDRPRKVAGAVAVAVVIVFSVLATVAPALGAARSPDGDPQTRPLG